MLIVKANAYGAGDTVAALMESYVDCYGVARVAEAVRLRKLGVTKDIVVLSSYRYEYHEAVGYNIIVTASSMEDIIMATKLGLPMHIVVDSGMNRYGFKNVDYASLALQCRAINADICGVYSHIYHNGEQIITIQLSQFHEAAEEIKAAYPRAIAHIASSGSLACGKASYDMVRLGLDAYNNTTYITSQILLTKDIDIGESVSYGGLFVAQKPTKIAIIEGGYADGIPKSLSGHNVIIGGAECPIIGAICMDCMIADVTAVACDVGDSVVTISGNACRQTAKEINMSEYELLTGLKGRYNYVYYN